MPVSVFDKISYLLSISVRKKVECVMWAMYSMLGVW